VPDPFDRELRTKRPESSRTIIVPQSKRTAEVTTGNNVRNVMKNVSANVGEIPPESIQGQLGTYVGEDDILRLVEFV
jgi:hypothetical protein